MPNLYVERLPIDPDLKKDPLPLPVRATTHSANYDVFADIKHRLITCYNAMNVRFELLNENKIILSPGDRAIVPTGFKMCSDIGWKIELYSRSGNSVKFGVTLSNNVGQIDCDFRHELKVLLSNNSDSMVTIHHNDRIAQLALEQVHNVHMIEGTLPEIDSNRKGGLGSSGSGNLVGQLNGL